MHLLTEPTKVKRQWYERGPLEGDYEWQPFRVRDWEAPIGELIEILQIEQYIIYGARAVEQDGEEYVIHYDYFDRR